MSLGVVVIAGGAGTRLRSVTGPLPKALAPLGRGTLLSHLLERVAPLSPERVVVLGGHQAQAIRAVLPLDVGLLVEESPLGTAGGLHQLPTAPKTWLSLNIDHVSDLNLDALLAAHDGRATAVVHPVAHEIPHGVVQIENGKLTAWRERPVQHIHVTVGAYVFSRSVLTEHLHGQPMDMPELLRAMAPVQSFEHRGTWFDAGTPKRLLAAETWLQGR
ncbi:MAG: NDP-sugar pyrophosphorylase family protein [Cognaticolwellia sp.]|jgi:NDP-sugar pyrophosphorylase family protein